MSDPRSRAYLRVTSRSLSLAEVTRLLEVDPDYGWSLGEPYVPYGADPTSRQFTNWELHAAAGIGTIEDQLTSLHTRASAIRFEALQASEELAAVLEVVQYLSERDNENVGLVIDPAWVVTLANLGAYIDVDQYLD